MRLEYVEPSMIEKRSFEIIEDRLRDRIVSINGGVRVDDDTDPVVISIIKRCIHTTADFDYAQSLCLSENAVGEFTSLIKAGATLVCDTNMALSGINKAVLDRYGCPYYCFMAEEDVKKEAKERKVTRAQVSMERAMALGGPVIFVIGNAPTALIALKDHYDKKDYVPAFVVGAPVGFVNVVAAKEMIMDTSVPYIVNKGQKGGSNVAAAIVNACLYGMTEDGACSDPGAGKLSDEARTKNRAGAKKGFGFTTGTCAQAAAKAATVMLLEQRKLDHIKVMTPAGISYEAQLCDVMLTKSGASCAVQKPESDDPDVTAGLLIYAEASFVQELPASDNGCVPIRDVSSDNERVIIEGGAGIGKLTRPGLDRQVGEWAINSVPRAMISREVMSTADEHEYFGAVKIVISAPGGEKIAQKTFNKRFGIEGGISIIGTSGIVEPMSTKAIIDTIKAELSQKKAMGADIAVITPGNYGLDFMKDHFGYDLENAVKCSNFIGETVDFARDLGFVKLLLVGHAGKLVKLSGGIMNTHSAMADCRMELMAAAAVAAGVDSETVRHILYSVSTEEAYGYLRSAGSADRCFEVIMEKIYYHLNKRSRNMRSECIVYSTAYGLSGATEGALELMRQVKEHGK